MEITHDYVDLETAKLLKEKGFNQPVFHHYSENPVNDLIIFCKADDPQMGQGWILVDYNNTGYLFSKWSAPELWMVIKWLRVVHSIFIGIELIDNSRESCYQPTIWTMKDREYQDEDCMDQAKSICNWKEWKYSTPEEAELEAIKYCLNNLI